MSATEEEREQRGNDFVLEGSAAPASPQNVAMKTDPVASGPPTVAGEEPPLEVGEPAGPLGGEGQGPDGGCQAGSDGPGTTSSGERLASLAVAEDSVDLETPAPSSADLETPAPSSASPETPAPSSASPETPAPSSVSPETPAPSSASPETPSPSSASPSPGAASRPETSRSDPANTFHFVKWISWKGQKTPLITQSENGPCPLIAIINILLLRWKVKLPPKTEVISMEQLMTLLGDCILSTKPKENSQGLQLNFEQNMNDAMSVLPKLSTGLDVNVRFTGVGDFEYTPECIVFDLLHVPLYHGWLVDPQSCEVMHAIGRCSYNQLVEKIISSKLSTDSALVSEGLVAEQFLDATATQLTYHGLCELTAAAKEDELCVFFRNNHFSTLIKHKAHLYLLVTDQGFLSEQKVVWESLHNVEGDGNFCDAEFCLSHPSGRQLPFNVSQAPQEQIDQDYMVALSLQQQQQGPGDISDVELAKRLQEEEDKQALQYLQQQEHEAHLAPPTRQAAGAARTGAGAGRAGAGERRTHREEKTGKDCSIL